MTQRQSEIPAADDVSHHLRDDLTIAARGVLMGAADVVPGVSGGTVALIVGVYARLITALARFDADLLRLVTSRQFLKAARHIDLRFLIALGVGILSGIVALARIVNHLLLNHHQVTFAAFYGLILASGILVSKRVGRWTLGNVLLLAVAIVGAFWFTGAFAPAAGADESSVSLGYVFLCGCIAICAMILPGISGSFILLILGAYGTVIGMVSSVTKGEITSQNVLGLSLFGLGCLIGLLSFSKILRWLLTRYQSAMLAVLCGIMLGAIRAVWPFRTVTENDKGRPQFGPNLWPELSSEVWMPAVACVLAFAFVLGIDWLATHWTTGKTKDTGETKD